MPTLTTDPPTRQRRWMRRILTAILIFLLAQHTLTRAAPSPNAVIGDETTIEGMIWLESTCDGIRQDDEPALAQAQSMSLFYIGADEIPFTHDDSEVGLGGAPAASPIYRFTRGSGGGGGDHRYYIAIWPRDRPPGLTSAPWQQGSDPTRDNDLRLWPDGTWATASFVVPNGAGLFAPAVTGIDLGLCTIQYTEQIHLPLVIRP